MSSDIKIKVQSFGRFLSNMVMPNIGAFIAWGIITALFIPTGWLPNETLAKLVGPMITYLLPLLIGYTGGKLVGGERGGVVGAITTMGVIVGADMPMFLGSMIAGPLGGWAIKTFDRAVDGKIKSGFEMLVNNFSAGIIGMLLAILAFSLCLLGTFLVRSGVLISVHSFASDPTRGMFILALLVITIGGSLLLFAIKGGKVRSRVRHELWSRESLLLGNNVLLIAAMLVVLLGTLLPLIHKLLGLGSISIGEPFFNSLFIALMIPFSLLLGIGPLVRWRRDEFHKLRKRLLIAAVVAVVLAIALPWLMQDRIKAMTVVGLLMSLWAFVLTVMEVVERATDRHPFWRGLTRLGRSHWGMVAGHVGLVVTVIGIAFSQNYSIERDVRMKPGDSVDIHQYHFVFRDVRDITGPNYFGGEGVIEVSQNGHHVSTLRADRKSVV